MGIANLMHNFEGKFSESLFWKKKVIINQEGRGEKNSFFLFVEMVGATLRDGISDS